MNFALTCLTDKERAISCLVLFVHAIFSFLDTTFARFNILTNIDSFHINIWLYTLQSISCPFSSFVSTKSFQRNRVLRHYASRVARQLQWRLHRSLKPGWPVKPQVAQLSLKLPSDQSRAWRLEPQPKAVASWFRCLICPHHQTRRHPLLASCFRWRAVGGSGCASL